MAYSPTAQFRQGNQHKLLRRSKGTPNVTTGQAKAALHAVFESLGGVRGMTEWAQQPENRGEFYKLWSKLLPTEVEQGDNRIQIVILPAQPSTPQHNEAQASITQAIDIQGKTEGE